MGLNWKGGARSMLRGMQVDYRLDQEMQRDFQRSDRLAQTAMNKEKELYGFKKAADKRASDASYQEGIGREQTAFDLKKGRVIEEEGRQRELLKGQSVEDGTLAGEQKVAQVEAELAQSNLVKGSPEYQAAFNQKMGIAMSTEDKAREVSDALIAGARNTVDELFPELAKDGNGYKRKVKELAGVAKKAKTMSGEELARFEKQAKADAIAEEPQATEVEINDAGGPNAWVAKRSLELFNKSVKRFKGPKKGTPKQMEAQAVIVINSMGSRGDQLSALEQIREEDGDAAYKRVSAKVKAYAAPVEAPAPPAPKVEDPKMGIMNRPAEEVMDSWRTTGRTTQGAGGRISALSGKDPSTLSPMDRYNVSKSKPFTQ